jgi:hypothetical protein
MIGRGSPRRSGETMERQSNGLIIDHIHIGFAGITQNMNYADCHRSLKPFGLKWGRGILIKGENYIDAVTGPYGISHSMLKDDLRSGEQTAGAFYYGYNQEDKTLYLEYASDNNFDFRDEKILNAIMDSLQNENGPMKDFRTMKSILVKSKDKL